ncbi:hypothetical protein [Ligilactobacillus ruminis]|uniref:hypothetical protein n=1 Tax=Ligilactobacillus ruminis TaxID=1623 RepID=UPI003D72CEFF
MVWRAALSGATFVKITAVYGHIDENEPSVRKRPARKMAITDKRVKNSRLSVKYVLLTDKSSKIDALSVNLSEILAKID